VTAKAVDRGEAERRRADEITLRLAHFDGLTGLPNRLMFEDRLRRALARAERAGGTVALLFLDLDGFKEVNDVLGHGVGDQVLKQVAARIETALRSVDTAARLGGDEFTIILEQIKKLEDIQVVVQRLLLVLSEPYLVAGIEARVSASVGVSTFPTDTQVLAELMSQADAAMYRAKRAGKNQVAFHGALPA
jgi:diguanylate cyclase (GGDEF)-like protein